LNYQLNFINANKTIETFKNKESLENGINSFFDSIQMEYIDKIKKEIQICRVLINKEKDK
jgi:hypothetical protein